MTEVPQKRVYVASACAVFRKTGERYGGLSNMAPGFPLLVNRIRIWTAEALYQSCRFPNAPEIQKIIIAERSPMTGKMKSKRFRNLSRPDWEHVRVRVMRWCLRVKLAQNWSRFGELLLMTGDMPIVEESAKDKYWGAMRDDAGRLVGANVLGRLLMELREEFQKGGKGAVGYVAPPEVPNFLLLGGDIGTIEALHRTESVAERAPMLQFPSSQF
jgi:type I restriction enzyme S subunit